MIEHGTLDLADMYNGAQVGDGLQKSKHTAIDTHVQTDKCGTAEIVVILNEGWY
jgi:hypothetical protein